jgi:hypothetical protein
MNEFKIGLISGFISSFVCNPLDVIRVHYQTDTKISNINFKFLYRGINNTLITVPTFWSIYFPFYNKFKFDYNFNYTAGYIAGNIASTITCPLFFIKQKNQLQTNFKILDYYNKNGFKPFYNALISTYLINLSLLIQIPLYDNFKSKLINYNTFDIFFITLLSKTIATSITYPFDTIRTIKRENINLSNFEIIKKLNKNYINFYKGFNIYLLRSLPYHASIFCTYEYLKKY